MRKISKIACCLLTMFLSTVLILPTQTNAVKKVEPNNKLLVIVENINVFDSSLVASYASKYDIIQYKDINYSTITNYSNYAVPSKFVKTNNKLCNVLKNAFNNYDSRIYIYGEVRISDFKRVLNIKNFGANVNVYDENGSTAKTAFLSFGKEQEYTYIENIISYSNSQTQKNLIATVAKCDNMIMEYIKIIISDCCKTGIMPMASIVQSGFNYRSYYCNNYINMDYLLYRDYDEQDPNYDYFAIKTNVSAYGGLAKEIDVEHRLPYLSDELIDYGPYDINRAGSVSVGLDLGGGSLSYSFDVGGGPTIDATYNSSVDYCTWKITKYWFFGSYLNNQLFKPGSSWASTGTYAGTDITFRAAFEGPGEMYLWTPWQTVQVRYDY